MSKLKQIPNKFAARTNQIETKQAEKLVAEPVVATKPDFYLPDIVISGIAGEEFKIDPANYDKIRFIRAVDIAIPYEFYGADHDMHRWSGPSREAAFSIDASDKSDVNVCICINPRPDRKRGLGLFVKVDNVYVDHCLKMEEGAHFLWFKIKKKAVPGSARISVIVDTTYVPREVDPNSPDQRQIGFSLRGVWTWIA